jgi:hypothetical protein
MGGLGWKDMAIEQGLQNIARLIVGMHDDEILGTMTNIMLNQWKWLIGFDPFQHYKLQTPHDESIWLKNIRIFMIEKGIQIKKTVQAHPLLREKDEYLMQKAIQLELDTKEIRFINYCRLYLNVITISDITEPDGIHICPEIYHLDKAVMWRQRSDTRCNQQLPEKRQCYAWRKLIKNLTLFG